jgi:2',3'-cyclic-nucleotide 2'-phosphodiesterase (5'-nucleotidase family)
VLPPALPGTALRILATNDLGATFVPVPTSFGASGTCAGIVALLEQERAKQPTFWLDAGDLTFGPVTPLLGRRPWTEIGALPIAAAAVGNHDLDDGVEAFVEVAGTLPFPVLSANLDIGLPPTALLVSDAAPVGVIGLTTSHIHRFTDAPPPVDDWADRVPRLAEQLRADGARWVIALQHEGAAWWPRAGEGSPATAARPDRWARFAESLAPHVDLILGGHMLGAWSGRIAGTPAGHAFAFETSVLVVDLPDPPAEPVIRGCWRVPPRRPEHTTPAVAAVDAAAGRVVATSREAWLGKTGATRYLPDLVAAALRAATGADAALVPGGQHNTQAPLDGAISSLRAGPVTELDLFRLFPYADDRPVLVTLGSGEYLAVRGAHDAVTSPSSSASDHVWWNAIRMPAGSSRAIEDPERVAVMPFVVSRLSELLDRELVAEVADVSARDALAATLARHV